MALDENSLEAGENIPELEVILDVASECGCSQTQALNLLRHSGNDADKAKHRYRMLSRFMPRSLLERTMPPVPFKNPLLGRLQDKGDIEDFSDQGSDEEGNHDTPGTEENSSPKSSRCLPTRSQNEDRAKTTASSETSHQQSKLAAFPSVEADAVHSADSGISTQKWQNIRADEGVTEDSATKSAKPETYAIEHTLGRKDQEEAEEQTEWDFLLPRIFAPTALVPKAGEGIDGFSLTNLVGALQQGASEQVVRNYLGYFEQSTIKRQINEAVEGFPSIFFAVETNNDWLVRTWIAYGGDVNATHDATLVPLLAFAIVHSETISTDTSDIVATLLSLGAFTDAIPAAFYTPYCRDLPDDGPDEDSLGDLNTDTQKWLTRRARAKLARTNNLTNRYNLERASKTKKPSIRHKQVAYRRNAEALLGLPYFLIGQSMAANWLLQKCISYLTITSKKPLVLAFAGPSGHGKTELARRLGYLMSLELEVVDCTVVNREIELFGGRHPYVNADQGSSLNNFLARNSGKRCIVFLDEFEKTTREIHQALLLPFDNGEYQDRRKPNENKIDCSKTIWIIATNALDATIQAFCQQNEQAIFHDEDESKKMRLMKDLSKELKQDFLTHFGAPVTGRISAFLPFLPFSPDEQAVVAHKYLLELGEDVRSPVNLNAGQDERLVGNVLLRIRRDASVCRNLAEDGYHCDLGARSLITAVHSVRELLVDSYLGVDELITEKDGAVEFVVDVTGGEIVANMVHSKPQQEA